MELVAENKVADGWHQQYRHFSSSLNCDMRFAVFLPPQVSKEQKVPVVYWLSGLTCTDENFMQKAGAFNAAAKLGLAIVAPDTSPRGEGVADDENYDLGQGAGFYLNATQAPWAQHFQMYDYIVNELPKLVEAELPISNVKSISGHSMGGHGALTIGLKNQQNYKAISAFSPIVNPSDCPWGVKAFTSYLGEDTSTWLDYDALRLLQSVGTSLPILVDQGSADVFLEEQLKFNLLQDFARDNSEIIWARLQAGYDHSYFFIATFIEQHLEFHHKYLTEA